MANRSSANLSEEIPGLSNLLDRAWQISRENHGNVLSVHIPGMFVVNGRRGRFRAVSITGPRCDLACEHCKGYLLKTMPHAETPEKLIRFGLEASDREDFGILVTGGCDSQGRLPWATFLPAIRVLKNRTNLKITVHAGQVDLDTARALKDAGVDQALVDVIGDDVTAREVYHLDGGTKTIIRTLNALSATDLEIIPHVLFGLHFGNEKGEATALRILKDYPLTQYVVVVIMPAKETPMANVLPPSPQKVAVFLAKARFELPGTRASLGCARPRGLYRSELDVLAVHAGINALALPSDRSIREAEERGLIVYYRESCCSLANYLLPEERL